MKISIGTRGSKLALVQTEEVIKLLKSVSPELETNVDVIKTLGDRKQGTEFASNGDKQDWMDGLDSAIVEGKVDIAVHSAKDIPVDIHLETVILPVGKRIDARDVFIPQKGSKLRLESLPKGAKIGSASLRRKVEVNHLYPEIEFVEHRGNITTRLLKFYSEKTLDGLILAKAGLERIKLFSEDMQILEANEFIPAVNQGTLVVQFSKNNIELADLVKKIVDKNELACFYAEREIIRHLDADCHSAIGSYAEINQGVLSLHSRVYSHDAKKMIESKLDGDIEDAKSLGKRVAEELLIKGAGSLLAEASSIQAAW